MANPEIVQEFESAWIKLEMPREIMVYDRPVGWSSSAIRVSDEVVSWLDEHTDSPLQPSTIKQSHWFWDLVDGRVYFYFRSEAVALMFKLRWAGA